MILSRQICFYCVVLVGILGLSLPFVCQSQVGERVSHDHVVRQDIHDIQEISETLPFVDEKTLLVFDLDNTLIMPKQVLGSDEWFDLRYQDFLLSENSPKSAIRQFAPIYRKARTLTQEQVIESNSVSLIRDYQEKGVWVLVLTSRDKVLYAPTLRNLDLIGFSFQEKALEGITYRFLEGEQSQAYGALIFAGGQHKGRILSEYVNYLKTALHLREKLSSLNKIVFVDDKAKYINQVAEYAKDLGFHHFVGLRYAGVDEKIASVHQKRDIVSVQEEFLGKILTDEAANDIVLARKARKVLS